MTQALSGFILVFFLGFILIYSVANSNDTLKSFTEGIKDGLRISLRIFPNVFALLFAIELFIKSGTSNVLGSIIWPFFKLFGIFKESLPLIIIKPFSGSASYGVVKDLFERYGVDSKIGIFSSIFCASTETLFYVITTYLAASRVKRTRYLIAASLIVDFIVIIICAKLVQMTIR